ncbi:MAG: outer membrane beta-barrel protein [Bacteroidales bacterium]|nr:outer membrane beta-barrel protein [Bacteroidales bacterium]
MKKIFVILLSAVALFTCANASAQSTEWRAGLGYAGVSFNGDDCSTFLKEHHLGGFYAGISKEFYFSTMAGLTFEPGVFFYYHSGKTGLPEPAPKFMKMSYLSIPLNIKYNFEASPEMLIGLYTGPVLNIGTGGNVYSKDKFITNTDLTDATHKLTQMNIQWDLGLTAAFSEAVQVRVGYAFGLSRLVKERDVHANTFTVGVAFMF